jgi:hypothetical protein
MAATMTKADIPDEVRRFILTSVPSVPYLEAIILLRAEPKGPWDAQRLSRRLYLPEPRTAELLQALAAAGIAEPAQQEAPQRESEAFRFKPATPELDAMLDQLTRVYAGNLMGVTDLIHSRVDKRAQQFADAFRWRKDS